MLVNATKMRFDQPIRNKAPVSNSSSEHDDSFSLNKSTEILAKLQIPKTKLEKPIIRKAGNETNAIEALPLLLFGSKSWEVDEV